MRIQSNIMNQYYDNDNVLGTSVLPNQNRGMEISELREIPNALVIDRINEEPDGLRVF